MVRVLGFLGVAAISSIALVGLATATPSAPGAKVFFVGLENGATVKSPFIVHFGISGMTLAPAGTDTADTGHHHLLIDARIEGDALKLPMPADEHHLHFGKAQTEAVVTLPPGTHTLQLVLGDWTHVPHEPPVMSQVITVRVE